MALSELEQSYVTRNHCKRLTFDGVADLYQTTHGAHTIARAMELDVLQRDYWRNQQKKIPCINVIDNISDELSIANDRCIDEHGCGLF